MFSISINDVVDLLGLSVAPNSNRETSYYVRCPLCNDTGYHMNINAQRGIYRCVRCMSDEKGLSTLDLYSRVRHGARAVKGRNTKELYIELRNELGLGCEKKPEPRPEPVRIQPAGDDVLDEAYSNLVELPELRLSREHRTRLLKRGLNDKTIRFNQYATLPPPKELQRRNPGLYKRAETAYAGYHVDSEAIYKIRRLGREHIVSGLLVASALLDRGVALEGVPGFFQCGDDDALWCLAYTPGMIVPTRNRYGQIVGAQVRLDETKRFRYSTLSSKGLKGGVECGMNRIHFPLTNAPLWIHPKVLITEGPLKSDVAQHLLPEQTHFIAVQGVNNVQRLPEIIRYLKDNGVTEVYNALDMDKTTNTFVASASRHIRELFHREGIKVHSLMWDREFAAQKRSELLNVCRQNKVQCQLTGDVYIDIAHMTAALNECHIDLKESGSGHWRDDTKGIDDYLKNRKGQRNRPLL